jgi:hypothetical protein
MNRCRLAVAVLIMLIAPSLRAEEPDGCTATTTTTTTTTVKCTGAAAPLAVPAEATTTTTVAPAPDPLPPPAPVAPAPVAPAPVVVSGCVDVACSGAPLGTWRLAVDDRGRLWQERVVRKRSNGLWIGGLALTLSTWLLGAAIIPYDVFGWFPVGGAFMNAVMFGGSWLSALYAIDGLLQVGGWVMFIVGVARKGEKIERQRVTVGPLLLPSGGGVGIAGRF